MYWIILKSYLILIQKKINFKELSIYISKAVFGILCLPLSACSTSSDCTENNTMIDFGHGTVLLCQSILNLHPSCYNGGCYCFPGVVCIFYSTWVIWLY